MRRAIWLGVALVALPILLVSGCRSAGTVAGQALLPAIGVPEVAAPVASPLPPPLQPTVVEKPATGILRIRIRWPAPLYTQLIPSDTGTIALAVKDAGGSVQAYKEFARPLDATTLIATLSLKAAGNVAVEARTFRESPPLPPGAQATAQGFAAGVNVLRSRFSDVSITLESLSAPAIASLSANVARPGDSLTLFGSNLAPALPDGSVSTPSVAFNGATASVVVPVGAGEVQAIVPAGASCGDVLATVGNQASANPASLYVSSGVRIATGKETWDPTPAGSVLVLGGATASFGADARWVFGPGTGASDFPSLPAILWESSNRGVGVLDADGVFTATASAGIGNAATQVRALLGPLASTPISARSLILAVAVDPGAAEVYVPGQDGQPPAGYAKTAQLAATVTSNLDLAFPTVTWISSAAGVASVSGAGVATAVSRGVATVTARSAVDPRKAATATITARKLDVLDAGASYPVGLALSSSGGTLHARAADDRTDPGFVTRLPLAATVTYANDATSSLVVWTTSDAALGAWASGHAESAPGAPAGTFILTATTMDGAFQASASYLVTPAGIAEVIVQ